MICYIQKYQSLDIKDYIGFLEDVFDTSFKILVDKNPFFYKLESNKYKKFVLIRGENKIIKDFYGLWTINQQNLILITCTIPEIFMYLQIKDKSKYDRLKNKNVFLPKYSENDRFLTKYDGSIYGFKFDICKAELNLYRNRGKNIYDNLNENFDIKKIKSFELQTTGGPINGEH